MGEGEEWVTSFVVAPRYNKDLRKSLLTNLLWASSLSGVSDAYAEVGKNDKVKRCLRNKTEDVRC